MLFHGVSYIKWIINTDPCMCVRINIVFATVNH